MNMQFMYTIHVVVDKHAKDIAIVVVQKELRLQHYKHVLFNDTQLVSQMNSF